MTTTVETLDPAELPIGTLAVIAIGNVENIKAFKTSDKRWTYSENPDLGLTGTWSTNNSVQVMRVLNENEEVVPNRRPFDVERMNGRQIDDAVESLLGENEENDGDYYDDYNGANGFWHALAGTANSQIGKGVTRVNTDTLRVDGLGDFTKVEYDESYDETGDLDVELIYRFGGRTFKKACNLDSWQGGLWEGVSHEVKPVQVTVTQWEKI